jgi:hypothetical protein
MAKMKYQLPNYFADRMWELYTESSVDITCRDDQGHVMELRVPYDAGQGEIDCYRVARRGRGVIVELLGPTQQQCSLTQKERQRIKDLLHRIDEAKIPDELSRSPHHLRICT